VELGIDPRVEEMGSVSGNDCMIKTWRKVNDFEVVRCALSVVIKSLVYMHGRPNDL